MVQELLPVARTGKREIGTGTLWLRQSFGGRATRVPERRKRWKSGTRVARPSEGRSRCGPWAPGGPVFDATVLQVEAVTRGKKIIGLLVVPGLTARIVDEDLARADDLE